MKNWHFYTEYIAEGKGIYRDVGCTLFYRKGQKSFYKKMKVLIVARKKFDYPDKLE